MSRDFIGVEELLERHYQQVALFESWAESNNWAMFHIEHYDWWAFPIDKDSGFGAKYKVGSEEIKLLKENQFFTQSLSNAIALYLLSSGWDSKELEYLPDAGKNKKYKNHPIRLWKVWRSARIFDLLCLEKEVLLFANKLKQQNYNFEYGGKDLWPSLNTRSRELGINT